MKAFTFGGVPGRIGAPIVPLGDEPLLAEPTEPAEEAVQPQRPHATGGAP